MFKGTVFHGFTSRNHILEIAALFFLFLNHYNDIFLSTFR